MSGLSFVCPHARPDENGAHDIHDVMSRHTEEPLPPDDRAMYCARCGQAVLLSDALAETAADPDRKSEP